MSNKECLNCGSHIIGRADKKFCCGDCRSLHHAKCRRRRHTRIKNVNRILHRNWSVLNRISKNDPILIPQTQLVEEGFDFHYFTQVKVRPDGQVGVYCYDLGYIPDEKGNVEIIGSK